MRTFIAIELPPDLQLSIDKSSQRLRQYLRRHLRPFEPGQAVRWTPAAKFHLTLRFLGETSPSQQTQVNDGLYTLAKASSPLHLCVGQLGCFPDMRSPQVIWLGLGGDLPRLLQLQSGAEQVAQQAGYEAESRSFSPHLTIGRVQRGLSGAERRKLGSCLSDLLDRDNTLTQAQASTLTPCLDFDVPSLVLMQSVLKPEGAHYSVLERVQLGCVGPDAQTVLNG